VLLLLFFFLLCSLRKKYIATNSLLAAAHRAAGKFLQAYAEHEENSSAAGVDGKALSFPPSASQREEFILIKHTHTIERTV
jgi:hypothetical protein